MMEHSQGREISMPDNVIREFIELRNRFFDSYPDDHEPSESEEQKAIEYAKKYGSSVLQNYLK